MSQQQKLQHASDETNAILRRAKSTYNMAEEALKKARELHLLTAIRMGVIGCLVPLAGATIVCGHRTDGGVIDLCPRCADKYKRLRSDVESAQY